MDSNRSGFTGIKNAGAGVEAGNIHQRCSIEGIGHPDGVAIGQCPAHGRDGGEEEQEA
jgi:hypothetical protein